MRKDKVLVIVNPYAGVMSKDIATSYIFKTLRRHFTNVSLINSNTPEDGYRIAKSALNEFDIITAFGGD